MPISFYFYLYFIRYLFAIQLNPYLKELHCVIVHKDKSSNLQFFIVIFKSFYRKPYVMRRYKLRPKMSSEVTQEHANWNARSSVSANLEFFSRFKLYMYVNVK
jgi:hypothetical protein